MNAPEPHLLTVTEAEITDEGLAVAVAVAVAVVVVALGLVVVALESCVTLVGLKEGLAVTLVVLVAAVVGGTQPHPVEGTNPQLQQHCSPDNDSAQSVTTGCCG